MNMNMDMSSMGGRTHTRTRIHPPLVVFVVVFVVVSPLFVCFHCLYRDDYLFSE